MTKTELKKEKLTKRFIDETTTYPARKVHPIPKGWCLQTETVCGNRLITTVRKETNLEKVMKLDPKADITSEDIVEGQISISTYREL